MKTTEIIEAIKTEPSQSFAQELFFVAVARRMEYLRQLCSDARDELVQLSCSEAGLDELIDKLTEAKE